MNNFYTIGFTNATEIQSILGFESSILEKGIDNPKRYLMNTNCNQIVVTNGTERHILSISTGYYTYLEFIEAVGTELSKVITTISMTIEDKYVKFNVEGNEWYFDRDTTDTTIDGFGWTPWFKLSPSTQNLCIELPVDECLILMVHLYLMRQMMKDWEVMYISIHPMWNMTGN